MKGWLELKTANWTFLKLYNNGTQFVSHCEDIIDNNTLHRIHGTVCSMVMKVIKKIHTKLSCYVDVLNDQDDDPVTAQQQFITVTKPIAEIDFSGMTRHSQQTVLPLCCCV